jgi:CMP-N-acetylneuraminic acid synthetase
MVTVYITNYNYGKYIKKAIESVFQQTFQDYELIIIDDGSIDKSMEIISFYEGRKNVRVVIQDNKGLTVSNNIALKLSNGKYIMRLDADDYLEPNALSVLVEILENDDNIALVFPDYFEVDEDGNLLRHVLRHDFAKNVTLYDQPAHGACTMIRTAILREVGGYDEAFLMQDGYDLWMKVIYKYSVRNVNKPLFNYRKHSLSLTKNENTLLKTRYSIIKKHVEMRGLTTPSVLAVIPVRGTEVDSRSLPLELLGDRCLIDWTIDAALNCDEIGMVIVTTTDQKVLDHVENRYCGKVICHKRTIESSRINTPIEQTLVEVLSCYYSAGYTGQGGIIILTIENPFRDSMYISKAINIKQLHDVDVVIGVRMDDDTFYMHDGSGLKPRTPDKFRLERDELYRNVGGFSLFDIGFFYKEKTLVTGRFGHIILDQKAAFKIRSELDWIIARAIVNK